MRFPLPLIAGATSIALSLFLRAEDPASSPQKPIGKIVLVGASVTAGFVEEETFGGPRTELHRLNRYMDAALTGAHPPIENLAAAMMFLGPEEQGQNQIKRALALQPAAIVSADLLFWFCYGELKTGDTRAALFERGLKLIDRIACPLVLGDLPDARAVAGKMLSADQVPSVEELAAANSRLHEWAVAHKNATIVPLSAFMRDAQADAAITVHGITWGEGHTRELFQPDGLHPAMRGCAALALALLDALTSAHPAFPAAGVQWDADKIQDAVGAAKPRP